MDYLNIIAAGSGVLIGLTPVIIDNALSAHPYIKVLILAVALFIIIVLTGTFIQGEKAGLWVMVGMVLVLVGNRIYGK